MKSSGLTTMSIIIPNRCSGSTLMNVEIVCCARCVVYGKRVMSSFDSSHSIGENLTLPFAFIPTIPVSKRRVHWSLYPTGPEWRRFPENASNELLGALLSSGIDSLTSKVSTSPFTVAEMESMRDFIKEAENLGTENPHVITSVARLLSFYGMYLFPYSPLSYAVICLAHWRFLHFHGQKTSRQDRYKSIYKDGHRKRTILIRIFSPILFFFPDAYLRELQKLWMDKIIVEALWKESTQRSTVMLTANVAFLAVPGVIVAPQYPIPPNTWIKPSPAQIASSISLDPNSVWHYLYGMKWPVVGLEPLPIAFGLTYALLMWSVWGFFVALLIFSFQDTSSKIWIAVGIAAGIVIIAVVWCIKNTWDPEKREEEHTTDRPYEPDLKVWNGTQA
ncbi:hypothetical protein EDB86DRAFT_831279 [Lactarius hatsudake]|nr:hypothetical protein EDB86DRAFT_831279 [Lactarius hatsudake]